MSEWKATMEFNEKEMRHIYDALILYEKCVRLGTPSKYWEAALDKAKEVETLYKRIMDARSEQ